MYCFHFLFLICFFGPIFVTRNLYFVVARFSCCGGIRCLLRGRGKKYKKIPLTITHVTYSTKSSSHL